MMRAAEHLILRFLQQMTRARIWSVGDGRVLDQLGSFRFVQSACLVYCRPGRLITDVVQSLPSHGLSQVANLGSSLAPSVSLKLSVIPVPFSIRLSPEVRHDDPREILIA